MVVSFLLKSLLLLAFQCCLQSNQSAIRSSSPAHLLRAPKSILKFPVSFAPVLKFSPVFKFFRAWNFFPLPLDNYCNSSDQRRLGTCMNPYECRLQGGKADGSCASGFGVCCLFVSGCDQETSNNITYFISPNFPDSYASKKTSSCTFRIKKVDEDVQQVRLDFVHFNMAQPNKLTGLCDEDSLQITNDHDETILNICGSNNDQHVYVDMGPSVTAINLTMSLKKQAVAHLWEIRVVFLTEEEAAPSKCLQLHTGASGVLKSFNFFENGRLLANQEYNICIRQERRMCSIVYQLCDQNSFSIGALQKKTTAQLENKDPSNSVGNITLDFPISLYSSTTIVRTTTVNGFLTTKSSPATPPTFDNEDVDSNFWHNHTVYQKNDDFKSRQNRGDSCVNEILMPCQSYVFKQNTEITNDDLCSVSECGSSFCPFGLKRCRLESGNLPFLVRVRFGIGSGEEDGTPNAGVCLKYEQQPCAS